MHSGLLITIERNQSISLSPVKKENQPLVNETLTKVAIKSSQLPFQQYRVIFVMKFVLPQKIQSYRQCGSANPFNVFCKKSYYLLNHP